MTGITESIPPDLSHRRNSGQPFMPWKEQAELIRQRQVQPIEVNGETFVGITAAAKLAGVGPTWLRTRTGPVKGIYVVLMVDGIKFYRKPRHDGDMRPLVYYEIKSMNALKDRGE